jgi:ribosome-associated translation inhibitor RaiA
MHIAIHAPEPVAPQVRAYIEYRIFSAIGRFGRKCVRLSVRLTSTEGRARHRCSLALDLEPPGHVRVGATAGHLYAAVDQSARRLSRAAERRLAGNRPAPRRRK